MPYPEFFVAPMRQELTDLGVRELRTPADVDAAVTGTSGTLMIVVNSVCGCAAGKARPGIALALRHANRPDIVATVFAGADIEPTARAGLRPGRPSVVARHRDSAARQGRLHAGAEPNRKPRRARDRGGAHRGI